MKVLHVASFTGNLGDNVSHIGLQNIFSNLISGDIEYTQLEIRRFYKNYSLPDKMSFDEKFVELANNHDLLVIGGGGFLDYWVQNSATGTTIDITPENFENLKVPTLITSVGCIPHKTVPEGNIEKFKNFIFNILKKPNVELAIRNDGSTEVLSKLFDKEVCDMIPVILDNGFFYQQNYSFPRITNNKYIAINTTLDQLKMNNSVLGNIRYDEFLSEIVKFVNRVIQETDLTLVFTPHIYQDIAAVQEILSHINDFYIRTRIVIAPYVQGDYGCSQLLSVYKYADYVIGMRFHANVCSVAMNKPISGFAALDRVIYLYDSFDGNKMVVPADSQFADKLFMQMRENLGKELSVEYQLNVMQKKKETLETYRKMLKTIGVIKS